MLATVTSSTQVSWRWRVINLGVNMLNAAITASFQTLFVTISVRSYSALCTAGWDVTSSLSPCAGLSSNEVRLLETVPAQWLRNRYPPAHRRSSVVSMAHRTHSALTPHNAGHLRHAARWVGSRGTRQSMAVSLSYVTSIRRILAPNIYIITSLTWFGERSSDAADCVSVWSGGKYRYSIAT